MKRFLKYLLVGREIRGRLMIENNYLLVDMSGKVEQRGTIISENQKINVSELAPGNYTIKLADREVIKWLKN